MGLSRYAVRHNWLGGLGHNGHQRLSAAMGASHRHDYHPQEGQSQRAKDLGCDEVLIIE